jgi:site-specific DNA-cytosine methylase
MGVRRLTPIECERLQGFPDGWTEGHADSHRYRMMGNAVAVPVRHLDRTQTDGREGAVTWR